MEAASSALRRHLFSSDGAVDRQRRTKTAAAVATAVVVPLSFLWIDLDLALLFVSAVGLGPFAGALALSIGSAGLTAKLLGDAIEAVRPSPRDSAVSTGASRLQELSTAVVPQVAPSFVATVLYVLDVNIRNSVILGIVGGGGIGFILTSTIRRLDFERTGAILIAIFVVVYGIERLAGWVRSQLI